MRFWIRAPLGLVLTGLYLEAAAQVVTASGSTAAILWALVAIAGVFSAAYLWHRWWASAAATTAANVLLLVGTGPAHPTFFLTVVLASLVGWWSTRRPLAWPLTPGQAFSAILVLIIVSVSLSGVLNMRAVPIDTQTAFALAVVYLSTPPWEWTIVLLALTQGHQLRRFIAENYQFSVAIWRQALWGLACGLGLVLATAVLVTVESHGLKVHIHPNNPFVYAPRLTKSHLLASGLIAFGVVIMAPLAEEALFRGILFGSLSNRWGYLWGTVTSAAVFGLAHLDLSLLIPLGLAGLVLNALYRRTRSLIPSTIAHATLNAVSVLSALGIAGAWHW